MVEPCAGFNWVVVCSSPASRHQTQEIEREDQCQVHYTVEDRKSAILVPPEDPAALADGICLILETPSLACKIAAQGRKEIVNKFSIDSIARQYRELYKVILTSSKT